MAGAGSAVIKVVFSGDSAGAKKAAEETEGALGRLGNTVRDHTGAMIVGLGSTTAAFAFLGSSIKDASADASEQSIFENTVRNAGATDQMVASLNDAVVAGQKLGFTDTELRDTYSKMFERTKDVETAHLNMATAMNIARRANVPLEAATDAVTKALNGNNKQLKAMLPQYADMISTTKDTSDMLGNLDAAIGTQAETWAGTSEGQLQVAKIQFQEIKESIGAALLPVLAKLTDFVTTTLLPAFQSFVDWVKADLIPTLKSIAGFFDDNKAAMAALAVVIAGVVVPAFISLAVSAWAAAAPILAMALSFAAPVAILAALAAGVVYAYQHFDIFRNSVNAVVDFFRDDFIPIAKIVGEVLLALATGGLSEVVIRFGLIKDAFERGFGPIKDVIDSISDAVSWLIHEIKAVLDLIPNIHLPSLPSWAHIPGFASGGIVTGPTLAMVGEAGPEAIIPLNQLGTRTRGGDIYNIQVSSFDPAAAGRLVEAAVLKVKRGNGGRFAA